VYESQDWVSMKVSLCKLVEGVLGSQAREFTEVRHDVNEGQRRKYRGQDRTMNVGIGCL